MAGRIEYLHKQLETKDLPKHDDLVKAIRNDEISEEMFEKYGAVLALQWVIGRVENARDEQEDVDLENELNQSELDLAEERRHLKRYADGLPIHDDVKGEEEDDFDPFPEDVHPGLSRVAWDDASGIVMPLLLPVDVALPHPKNVREKDRPDVDKQTFYTSNEQVFNGIFKIGRGRVEELGEGMATLTHMTQTKLI
jgi:hypothetical protein